MIFISHTRDDKPVVEPIALSLAKVFGSEKIFYDSWSIQPGDGIIDKTDEALARCQFFFFFVSKKSLVSNMVKLEWQNAVLKATRGQCKIIPVKLDDCLMPAVLLQTLYIDVFGYGLENAIRQMIEVVSSQSTYHPQALGGYQNVRGYIRQSQATIRIEFRAETYTEPHSRYLILLDNSKDDLAWKALEEFGFLSAFDQVQLSDGKATYALLMGRVTATSPGFPFIVELTPKGEKPIKVLGLMRATSKDQFSAIPVIWESGP